LRLLDRVWEVRVKGVPLFREVLGLKFDASG
jgi:hypothetical protein